VCGEHLWIDGTIPGITVEVAFDGSNKGSAIAVEDGAHLRLSKGLPEDSVTAWMSLPSGKGIL
jgi:hypothetical protein